jgi:hypothetical protein
MTLTIRDIPAPLEQALRERARAEGKTIDQVALDAISAAVGVTSAIRKRDLSDIAGTWVEDPQFDQIMREQDRIDPQMWK